MLAAAIVLTNPSLLSTRRTSLCGAPYWFPAQVAQEKERKFQALEESYFKPWNLESSLKIWICTQVCSGLRQFQALVDSSCEDLDLHTGLLRRERQFQAVEESSYKPWRSLA